MPNEPLDRSAWPCPKGTILFEEGQPGDRMYVIQSGRVLVTKRIAGTRVTIAQLGPGDCLGEMAIIDGQPRSADAIVAEDAVLLVLERSTCEHLIRDNGEIAVRIMRKLSQRLREANRRLETFLSEKGVTCAIELLRAAAGVRDESGHRALPAGLGPQALAARAGLSLLEASAVWDRLLAARVVRPAGADFQLAPDDLLEDYRAYLELKKKYDPLSVRELADMTGLPEDEVHRIIRRVLASRLQSDGLADSYQQFLRLKKRFEYLDRV